MAEMRYLAIRAALEALALSRLPRLLRHFSACRGIILTLHRVVAAPPAAFSPNAILQVTPDFLRTAIIEARRLGFETVSMDEAVARLDDPAAVRPFVVFTFDDAYHDTLTEALPVLQEQNCPFTLYVPTALVDGVGQVWWQALEDIIAANDIIVGHDESINGRLDASSSAAKQKLYDRLYQRMRTMPEADRVALLEDLAKRHGLDLAAHCRDLIMDWSEVEKIAAEPLCTIGAHTIHHYELSKLPVEEARAEISQSVEVIEERLGKAPRHFSYPIGSAVAAGEREYGIVRDIGLLTGVTTRPGGVYGGGSARLEALPRVSLNGRFQQRRYLDALLTGALYQRQSLRTGSRTKPI